LIQFCQGVGATLIPATLWGRALVGPRLGEPANSPQHQFYLRPHYRTERDLDATLRKAQAGMDGFTNEKYADLVAAILDGWTAALLRSPRDTQVIAGALPPKFTASSLHPSESRVVRSSSAPLIVHKNKFATGATLDAVAFLRELDSELGSYSQIQTAEFQITS